MFLKVGFSVTSCSVLHSWGVKLLHSANTTLLFIQPKGEKRFFFKRKWNIYLMSRNTNLNRWPELGLSGSLRVSLGVPGWVCDAPTEKVAHFPPFSVKCECVCNPDLLSKNNLVSPAKVNKERITGMVTWGMRIIWDFHLLLVGPPCPSRNQVWLLIVCQRMRPGPAYVPLKMHRLFPRGIMWFASQRDSAVVGSPRGKSGLSCLGSHRSQWAWADGWNRLGKFLSRHRSPDIGTASPFKTFPGPFSWVTQMPGEISIMKMSLDFQWGQCHLPPAPQPSSPLPHPRKPRDFTHSLTETDPGSDETSDLNCINNAVGRKAAGTAGRSSKHSDERDYEKLFFFFWLKHIHLLFLIFF